MPTAAAAIAAESEASRATVSRTMTTVAAATPPELDPALLAAAEAALDDELSQSLLAEDEDDESQAGIDEVNSIVTALSEPTPAHASTASLNLTPAAMLSPDRFDLAALPPAPIAPGSPSSPYRRCSCLGTLPGRACTSCGNSRWLKLCPNCSGEGIVSAPTRSGTTFPRRDRCGFCMGRGTIPARLSEITEAQEAWAEFERAGGKPNHPLADADGKILRGAKLPTPASVRGSKQGGKTGAVAATTPTRPNRASASR